LIVTTAVGHAHKMRENITRRQSIQSKWHRFNGRPNSAGWVCEDAAVLKSALARKWVLKDLDSRVLRITRRGEREFFDRCGVQTKS
jgi:hypothetical protein